MKNIFLFLFVISSSSILSAQEQDPEWLNQTEILTDIGFPEKLLNEGLSGTVVIRAHIDTNGRYVEHRILENPHPVLAELVTNEIERVHFSPAESKGRNIEFWVNIPFQFHRIGKRPTSMQYARWSFNRGKSGKAIKECKKMLKVCPYNLPVHLNLANYYSKTGKPEKAKQQLQQAHQAFEEMDSWYKEMGIPNDDYYVQSGIKWLKHNFEYDQESMLFEMAELQKLEKLLLNHEIQQNK